jgi:hypothetical protein
MVNVKSIIISVVVILLAIIIIRWLMGDSSKIDGLKDAKKVTKINAEDLEQSNASNFAYSTWLYVDDWSYRYGEPKIVLGRLDSDLNPSPSIVLGAIENNIKIETTVYSSAQSDKSSTHTCSVANIPIQKWVNVIVSLYGRTLDVYIDGKLVRTCVLPGVAKIANNAPVYVTPLGGFSGYTANIRYYGDALNPQQAYNIYREGYGGTGFGGSFPYSVKVEFLKDGSEQGSIEI